jgi:UDP:flavonoid glycosyltransferase YjiC (YdhE family)
MNQNRKILFAWDMGSNWGHIGHFLAVYPALKAVGFECSAAVPDIRTYGARLAAYGVELFASPRSEPKGRPPENPGSLAHILVNRGYGNVDELFGMVLVWRSLIKAVNPSVILIDAAPAAILAAESLAVPVLHLTSPFFIPPKVDPVPDFLPERNASPPEYRKQLCTQILTSVNAVRERFGLPEINYLSDLYRSWDSTLSTFPELDSHAPRGDNTAYRGALWNMGVGQPFKWPNVKGPRVFVYLRPLAQVKLVLNILKKSGWPTVACCPELKDNERKEYLSDSLLLSDQPFDMGQVVREADLGVHNGGHALVSGLLWHGIPQLLLPVDAEKELTTRCLLNIGAAVRPAIPATETTVAMALNKLHSQSCYREAAEAFAARYSHINQQTVVDSIVQPCLTLAETRTES